MTRINLVPPRELMDQHLFAEYREIKMIPKSLRRSLMAGMVHCRSDETPVDWVLRRMPAQYTLGKGHVSFFYNKGAYLLRRYLELKRELDIRGVRYTANVPLDPDRMFVAYPQLAGDYEPTSDDLVLIRARIAEKIALKPRWYRYTGPTSVLALMDWDRP